MKLSDKQLFVLSLIGIVVASVLNVLVTPSESRLWIDHEQANGIRGLRLWLEQTGYDVRAAINRDSDFIDLDVLFLLNPYNQSHSSDLLEWVEEGGTLIVSGATGFTADVLDAYGMAQVPVGSQKPALQSAPTLTTPPLGGILALEDVYGLEGWETADVDPVIHFTVDNTPVVASWRSGKGVVWYVGSLYPFTNRGLREMTNARFILNLLTTVPPAAQVGFSQGISDTGETLFDLLMNSSTGWAVLSAIVITYLYLALRGRRFGSPVPLPEERLRREPVEHIEAMANLFRYSGDRAEILNHYYRQVRRHLIQRYGLDPTLNDTTMINTASNLDATLDKDTVNALLTGLKRKDLNEVELIKAAQSADDWLKKSERKPEISTDV